MLTIKIFLIGFSLSHKHKMKQSALWSVWPFVWGHPDVFLVSLNLFFPLMANSFLYLIVQMCLPSQRLFCSYIPFFLIEAQLIYNVVLVSRVQQNDSDIHIYILFQILSIIDYYKVVSTVPCVIEQILGVYKQQRLYVNSKLQIYLHPQSPTFLFRNHKLVFYVCESISVL